MKMTETQPLIFTSKEVRLLLLALGQWADEYATIEEAEMATELCARIAESTAND